MPPISQREYWNSIAGPRWIRSHAQLGALLQPCEDALLERAQLEPGQSVIDVGCGLGAVTRAAANICGAKTVRGLDISKPMLAAAASLSAERALDIEFVEADAQLWAPPTTVDRILSRFGIMFFEQPAIAFANLRSWLGPEGTFTALCWQGPERNPWITASLKLIAARVEMPKPQPGAPGPMSLADPDHCRGLLREAGFESVELEDLPFSVRLDGDHEHMMSFYTEWGPPSRFYAAAPAETQAALRADFEALVERQYDGTGIALEGRAWAIQAR